MPLGKKEEKNNSIFERNDWMSIFNQSQKAYLLLADGTVFEGRSFGAEGTSFGEVVFTTSVIGYQETITDPTNFGKIVAQTFPLIGNYGVNDEDYESENAQVSGYIAREWCNTPSNFKCKGNINDFLKEKNVIGIHSIDTRCLTRIIRDKGVMNAVITTENVYDKKDEFLKQIADYKPANAVKSVTCKENKVYSCDNQKFKVAMVDFGCKNSLIKEFTGCGCEVTLVPATVTADEIKALGVNGIVFSNGAGNPEENADIIENAKEIAKLGIPMLGVCLGHQILAVSQGAKSEKMKYGHRGSNQPVVDLELGKTFVTTQNHGYVLLTDSITSEIGEITHINANDKSCAGIKYNGINAISVQFYPVSQDGTQDTGYITNKFIEMMEKEMH